VLPVVGVGVKLGLSLKGRTQTGDVRCCSAGPTGRKQQEDGVKCIIRS
jgi:hypothetical protein